MRPQERASPRVSGGQVDDGGPVHTVDEHGVARLALVGGHRDGRAARVGGDQPADRLRSDERLVRQGDHRSREAARRRSPVFACHGNRRDRAQPAGE